MQAHCFNTKQLQSAFHVVQTKYFCSIQLYIRNYCVYFSPRYGTFYQGSDTTHNIVESDAISH